MRLGDFEMRFLNQMKPRLLKEVECLKELETIIYPNKRERYIKYKRNFILNAFLTMAGAMFFLSHTTFTTDQKKLEDEFIKFCQQFGEIYTT